MLSAKFGPAPTADSPRPRRLPHSPYNRAACIAKFGEKPYFLKRGRSPENQIPECFQKEWIPMKEAITVIGLDFVNAYLIKTKDGYVLIDTGLPNQWERLEKELESAGCLGGALKLIILTHGDWDHTGNASRLREKYNVRVAMHPSDVNQVENGVFLKRKVRPLFYRIFFTIMMLRRKLQKNKISFPKFKPDILLSDGQRLEEYGVTAEVIHIPGHTPGSIGVITDEGDLFAGDTFVNNKKPEDARIIENPGQLKTSLAALKKMKIKTVYPGHGKPFLMEEFLNAR
jgi:hydroxyacylglutathione hydrolase